MATMEVPYHMTQRINRRQDVLCVDNSLNPPQVAT